MREKNEINMIDRSQAVLIKGKTQTSDFVDATPSRRVAMVWELTQELWSLAGNKDAQQRLQRNVAALRKK